MTASGRLSIRRYRPEDRAAVYGICVRTADAGGDARGQYASDDLMPDLFAGPYVELEPELAFVLDDGGRAVVTSSVRRTPRGSSAPTAPSGSPGWRTATRRSPGRRSPRTR